MMLRSKPRAAVRAMASTKSSTRRFLSNKSNEKVPESSKTPSKAGEVEGGKRQKELPPAFEESSSGGSGVGKLLLLTALSAPAGAAIYVRQNPSWNPEQLKGNEQWEQFRELVKSQPSPADKLNSVVESVKHSDVVASVTGSPKAPEKKVDESKTPEQLSAAISNGQKTDVKAKEDKEDKKAKEAKEAKKEKKDKKEEKKEKKSKDEKKEKTKDKEEKDQKEDKDDLEKKEKEEKEEKKAKEEKKRAKEEKKKGEKSKVKEETVTKVEDGKTKVYTKRTKVTTLPSGEKKKEKWDYHHTISEQDGRMVLVEDSTSVPDDYTYTDQELDKLSVESNPEVLKSKIEQQLRSSTRQVVENMQKQAQDVHEDMDKQYLEGIDSLERSSLVVRVAQLATEMKHRAQWESLRLQDALSWVQDETHKSTGRVLEEQHALHAQHERRALESQRQELQAKLESQIRQVEKDSALRLQKDLEAERQQLLDRLRKAFVKEQQGLEAQLKKELEKKEQEMLQAVTRERQDRAKQLGAYQDELQALRDVLDSSSMYEAFSHRVHQASVAAMALSNRLEAAKPLEDEVKALRDAGKQDPFIAVAIQSLSPSVIQDGAASVRQLQERFQVVKKAARRACLAPEDSGILGQMAGAALSYLVIPPGGPIDGQDADAVLSRAEYALKAGDVDAAVTEMKSLTGVSASLAKDWVQAAEDRLAVEQTASVVKAHVALLAASCS